MSDRARLAAVRGLMQTDAGGYSNLVWKTALPKTLSRRDAQFATALFYGTISRQLTLDHILKLHLSRPLEKLDDAVRAILRCGLYQCLYMDGVPVSAAVNESANLCAALKKTSAKGFVNAVLRKASGFDLGQFDAVEDDVQRRSLRYSLHPELVRLLAGQYPERVDAILAALDEKPLAAARVNTLATDTDALAAELSADGVETERGVLPDSLLLKGDYLVSEAFAAGRFRVQSLAAQCAVHALAPKAGERVLDLCAAPGGKTLTAAQMMRNQGEIVALDRYENRLKLLRTQAEKEGVTIVTAQSGDGSTFDGGTFDRVLCDVPCSALGEIAKRPELRQKDPAGGEDLRALQAAILRNGARQVKKGGRLVYSTCTIDRRENDAAADAFLRENPDFRAVIPEECAAFAQKGEEYLAFLPDGPFCEGFFIATFERI